MNGRKKNLVLAIAAALPLLAQAQQTTEMNEVVIQGSRPAERGASKVDASTLQTLRASTSDAASLLQNVPGVSLYGAGGVSSLPSIHGLADDRLRTKVDGMDLIASCPNHMNSALSYIDPSAVGSIKVYAGISPVSVGGDSIGGSIVVERAAPTFAAPGKGSLVQGEIGSFYRSNGHANGANLSATYATESFSANFTSALASAGNYKAGGNFKTVSATQNGAGSLPLDTVGSSAYKTRNHALNLALRGDGNLVEARFAYQDIPYEHYPNQRMDMLGNTSHSFNLRFLGQRTWGTVEARAYHEEVDHFMEFGPDKKFLYTAGNTTQGMPMRSQGATTGASVKFSIDLTASDLLRFGAEIQHYQLNDWWPAVTGSMGMGPNAFVNINNGTRDRSGLFGEWEKRLNTQWTTLAGLRFERVQTTADPVHGYNRATPPLTTAGMDMMSQVRDGAPFNNADRNVIDNNWDFTVLARYAAGATADYEFGFARKTRSPNLYERYTWSTANMMSIMNNFVGDGNGYIGDINLKPEVAHTLSATGDWHSADRSWELKATPFYTRVTDYIDAVQWNGTTNALRSPLLTGQFVTLNYANQSARLYGLDLSGQMPLATTSVGTWGLKGLVNYARGNNRDTGYGLYNVMPLNAKLTLTQKLGGWDNALEVVGVKAKDNLSTPRNEIRTPGYSLVHLRTSYTWKQARVDFGVENAFNKLYALPLGGAYTGQGSTMSINPGATDMPWGVAVAGPGRSIYAALNLKF